MKLSGTIWLLAFFLIILLSCQQEQGNLTAVNQEDIYVYGVWKAPTTDSAKQAITDISTIIQTQPNLPPQPATPIKQDEVIQTQHNTTQNDTDEPIAAPEQTYKPLPYLTDDAPENLLPRDGEVAGWIRARKLTTDNNKTIYQDRFVYSDIYPEIYRHYGFQKQAEVEYQSPKFGSIPLVLLEIFDMGTPENAFGIFSVNSYPQPKFEWIGCKAIISGKYLRFWKGKYFIQIEGYEIATGIRDGMIALARVVAKSIQDPPQKIPLLELFPIQHIRGTEKLFYTNWALSQVHKSSPNIVPQLTGGAIGVLALYNIHSKKPVNPYTVFIIRFPSITEAQSAYKQYRNALMSKNISYETDGQNGALLINEQIAEP